MGRRDVPGVRSIARTQMERHRAIVDRGNLHVRTEATCPRVGEALPAPCRQHIEQHLCLRRLCRRGESGTTTGARVGRQRELRHQQQVAAGRDEVKVHASCGIGEDPVAEDAFGKSLGRSRGIVPLDTDQREQAGIDARRLDIIDGHAGPQDSLDERYHRVFIACRMCIVPFRIGQIGSICGDDLL